MTEALGQCGGCYACCTKAGSPPFRNDAERAGLPQSLRDELRAYYASIVGDRSREAQRMPCLWLDEKSRACLHYADRPLICRDFVVGASECLQFIQIGAGVPAEPWPEDPR